VEGKSRKGGREMNGKERGGKRDASMNPPYCKILCTLMVFVGVRCEKLEIFGYNGLLPGILFQCLHFLLLILLVG